MRYLYTNTPDDGCHEVSPGVFGRPVHNMHMKRLLAAGWKSNPADVEAPEAEIDPELIAKYEAKFGKKPHHKMKAESIAKALEDDKA